MKPKNRLKIIFSIILCVLLIIPNTLADDQESKDSIIDKIICFFKDFTITGFAVKVNDIDLDLSYKSGTIYDEDDNGIEPIDGIIDFTIKGSVLNYIDNTITKVNGGGFSTTITSVKKEEDGYIITLRVEHDGCSGKDCKELSHYSVEAIPGTYLDISKEGIDGKIDLGPNLGSDEFTGFKIDSISGIGDGKAGSFTISYKILGELQDQRTSAKAGQNSNIAPFTVEDFKKLLNNEYSDNLCAIWTIENLDKNLISTFCNGNKDCCSFAGLPVDQETWDETFYVNYGSHNTGFNNMISAEIIYFDVNLDEEGPYSNVLRSEKDSLPAKFYEKENEMIRQCGESNIGTCRLGSQKLVDGAWSKCKGNIDPDEEICDNLDNDCDGLIDEELIQDCGSDKGTCSKGTQTCSKGKWSDCSGKYQGPSEEICDGLDNDCNGKIDEIGCSCINNDKKICGSDIGACRSGIQECFFGQYGECRDYIAPKEEECNGIDDDCDSFIDEGLMQECGDYFLGACQKGARSCSEGKWGVCVGSINPTFELCDNIDNDCDGNVDESLSRECGQDGQQVCYKGAWTECIDNVSKNKKITVCHNPPDNPENMQTIQITLEQWPVYKEQGGTLGPCEDDGCQPMEEICDGLDNDCDGIIDESITRPCGCECANTKVLLVLDDNHHNEDIHDIDQLLSDFDSLGVDVIKIDEPEDGLEYDDVKDYDLVWFSNPGWPVDDKNTLEILTRYVEDSNPLVMQGDDMSWAQGTATNDMMTSITGLKNINNGLDSDYTVNFEDNDHPLLKYLAGESFTYKEDDIDTSKVDLHDVTVLAYGTNIKDPTKNGPALIVRDLTEDGKGVIVVALLTFVEIEPRWQGTALTGNIINWLLNKVGKCECGTDIGACSFSTQTCLDGEWGPCEGIPPINEICNDIDDDCNGLIDDGITCECIGGQEEKCGTDIGACQSGTRICENGQWGECKGSIHPVIPEICYDNVDNDCDGMIDEDCPCQDKDLDGFSDISCGGQDCDDSNKNINPDSLETCNNLDDNCNGFVDEDIIMDCGDSDIGICSLGKKTCSAGIWGECIGEIKPNTEICNNLDDDCDGSIDEDLTLVCGTNIGECTIGQQTCSEGAWSSCIGSNQAQQETCDGLDNNCDGLVDNGINCTCINGQTRACGTDQGECVKGTQTCSNNKWSACIDYTGPTTELCDNLDNDCDGNIDEELTRLCGETDVGACKYGSQYCTDGTWSECQGLIEPTEEECDSIDNNCNGYIDEGCEREISIFTTDLGLSSPSTQRADSGTREFPSPSRSKSKGNRAIDVKGINLPKNIDIYDNKFPLQAVVENIGEQDVHDIKVTSELNEEWSIDPVEVGDLKKGEKKYIILELRSKLCTWQDPTTRSSLKKDTIDIRLTAKDGRGLIDHDEFSIPLNIPPFSIGLAETDYSERDHIKTCFFTDNKGKAKRDKLEIEFELYDQKEDIIIDFISPLHSRENEVSILRATYKIKKPLKPKIYNIRGYLLENGTAFADGYIVGRYKSTVDFSELSQDEFSLLEYLKNMFKLR